MKWIISNLRWDTQLKWWINEYSIFFWIKVNCATYNRRPNSQRQQQQHYPIQSRTLNYLESELRKHLVDRMAGSWLRLHLIWILCSELLSLSIYIVIYIYISFTINWIVIQCMIQLLTLNASMKWRKRKCIPKSERMKLRLSRISWRNLDDRAIGINDEK